MYNIKTNKQIEKIDDIKKAESGSKSDFMIKFIKNNMFMNCSIKCEHGAMPTILNHTPRSAKVFQDGGNLFTELENLDTLISYLNKERINGNVGEDIHIKNMNISEEFKITNIKVANYAEIHPFENADRWFKSRVSLLAYDEESGKERKTNMYLLVQANDIKEAFDNTTHIMKGTMGDYTIPAISESSIMDVFPYFSGEEGELEQLEKFNALKGSKPEITAAVIDTMEFDPAVVG